MVGSSLMIVSKCIFIPGTFNLPLFNPSTEMHWPSAKIVIPDIIFPGDLQFRKCLYVCDHTQCSQKENKINSAIDIILS